MSASTRKLLSVLVLGAQLVFSAASYSEQKIGSTYSAAMMDFRCSSDLVLWPSSTAEVAAHVATQLKAAAAAGTGLKVRVSHKSFHSTSPFTCSGASVRTYPNKANVAVPVDAAAAAQQPPAVSPASNVTSVTLLLDNMNRVLGVDKNKLQMRVQAGLFVTQLLAEAGASGMSVPLGSVPAFGDLTLGGVLATGGHGTGHLTTSCLGDIVSEITWVDGSGAVRTSARHSEAGRALVGGLGVAGIITELTLQLQGPSRTAVDTRSKKSDANLYGDILDLLQAAPHTLVVWRPDLKTYSAHLTMDTDSSAPITGAINNADVPTPVVQGLGMALQLWQADVHDLLPGMVLPIVGAVRQSSVDRILAVRNSFGHLPMPRGVCDTNAIQAISCGSKCLWNINNTRIAMDDVHFSIELAALGGWIEDVKRIVAADLWQHGKSRLRVMPPGYIWLRFGHGSDDYITQTAGLTAPVHLQMSFMKSLANPGLPGKYAWVLDTMEQLTVCKYKGKPHWGKNHERAFKHPACPIRDNLPRFGQLEAFAAASDPQGIFQPRLFSDIAARAANSYAPACATLGQCYCTEDVHCAAGFRCLPSLAFPEYRACRL